MKYIAIMMIALAGCSQKKGCEMPTTAKLERPDRRVTPLQCAAQYSTCAVLVKKNRLSDERFKELFGMCIDFYDACMGEDLEGKEREFK
jgi:hypothetical protein